MPNLKFLKKIVDKSKPKYKIDHNAYQLYIKKARAARKARGLCLHCYQPRALGDDWFCALHRQKKRERDRNRKASRVKAGLCRNCYKARVNKSFCARCAKIEYAGQRKRRINDNLG